MLFHPGWHLDYIIFCHQAQTHLFLCISRMFWFKSWLFSLYRHPWLLSWPPSPKWSSRCRRSASKTAPRPSSTTSRPSARACLPSAGSPWWGERTGLTLPPPPVCVGAVCNCRKQTCLSFSRSLRWLFGSEIWTKFIKQQCVTVKTLEL